MHYEDAVRGEAVPLLGLGRLPLGRLLAQKYVPRRVEARRVDTASVLGRAPPPPAVIASVGICKNDNESSVASHLY